MLAEARRWVRADEKRALCSGPFLNDECCKTNFILSAKRGSEVVVSLGIAEWSFFGTFEGTG